MSHHHHRALCTSAALALTTLAAPALAADLEGSISGYLPAGTYTITDDINVPSGQTLTLAPGVVFEFEDSFWEEYEFDVNGQLLAEGTSQDPIIFRTASGVSEYNYIRIASSNSILRHCIIEDAGKVSLLEEGGFWIDNASPLIEDCIIRYGSWHGVYVTGSSAQPVFRRTWSRDNANDGFDCASSAGIYLENCYSYDNGEDGIAFSDGDNTAVNCLIHGNDEDGIDCNGIDDYSATLVNCTVGQHPSEGLSDAGNFNAYNCLVADDVDDVGIDEHCLFTADLGFFGFINPGAGDYRLNSNSPAANYGTRFGAAGSLLPDEDLDGNDRIHGIVDAGAYESSWSVDPGTDGTHFSVNLLEPRLGQPLIAETGDTFTARIGLMGNYSAGDCSAYLTNPLGDTFPLDVTDVSYLNLLPGSDLAMQLHCPGLETVQELQIDIPADTPTDFYRIDITIGGYHYFANNAVSVYDEFPDDWGFIHITDTHIGYDDEDYTALERLYFFVEEANFLNPELVIVTGDICENQNMGHNWPLDFMNGIAELHMPVYVIAGNHDHYVRGSAFHPGGMMRYFQEINRFENSVLKVGHARFYGLNTGHDLGLVELYRCYGARGPALDWVENDLAGLTNDDKPRFFLTHGPNYDYFSWNANNTGRVRDIMNANNFHLGLAGHTHRFETFLNEGDNWFGRNDFEHEDDWGRDVAFPGYPLHVQTSSLGKEEHLSVSIVNQLREEESPEADAVAAQLAPVMEPRLMGIFGDDIGWRWVQVDGTDVTFFTADTDGDGYRNTEDPWLLGEIRFEIETPGDGSIISRVQNLHYETWYDVLHYIPADANTNYIADGGTIIRRLDDGTVIVAVNQLNPQTTSVVTLTPGSACPEDVNSDDVVNVDDVFAVLAMWGSCDDCPEDVNEDGIVNIDDLFAVLAAWGDCWRAKPGPSLIDYGPANRAGGSSMIDG